MYFVTGATGFVGSFVCKQLVEEGKPVQALRRKTSIFPLSTEISEKIDWVEGDIMDVELLGRCFEEADIVIHCAAVISFHKKDYNAMYKANVEGTRNVVNACLSAQKALRLIHLSSIAAIGRKKDNETIREDNKWESSPLNTGYARTKHQAELEVWRGVAEGLDAIILNPSVILGVGDWEKGSSRLFKYVWDEQKFYSTSMVNYVDVEDLVAVMMGLLKKDFSGERFIVSAGKISYLNLFEKIAERFDKKAPTVPINIFLLYSAIFAGKIQAFFTGKKPFITSEMNIVAKNSYFYDNSKVKQALQFSFRKLDETLDLVCNQFLATK